MCGFLERSRLTSGRQFSSAKSVLRANRVARSLRVSSSVRTIDAIHLLEKKIRGLFATCPFSVYDALH